MCLVEPSPRKPKQKTENGRSDISMIKQYFQVNVEMATPACCAECPNLQIDIDTLDYAVDNVDDFNKLRRIRCVNSDYCVPIYKILKKYKDYIKEENSRSEIAK
jgi:hypothetical protein